MKLLASVLAADGEDGNRLQFEKLRAKLFKLFPGVLKKKIDINSRGLFFLCELSLYSGISI